MCDCNCDGGDRSGEMAELMHGANDFARVITESAIYELPLRGRDGAYRIFLVQGDVGGTQAFVENGGEPSLTLANMFFADGGQVLIMSDCDFIDIARQLPLLSFTVRRHAKPLSPDADAIATIRSIISPGQSGHLGSLSGR